MPDAVEGYDWLLCYLWMQTKHKVDRELSSGKVDHMFSSVLPLCMWLCTSNTCVCIWPCTSNTCVCIWPHTLNINFVHVVLMIIDQRLN